jgi:sugar (pentulose or hexulose) kinase
MEALEATGIEMADLDLAGGGSMDDSWRQTLADVLGKRLLAADSPAGAARGAALLGGLAAGTFKSFDDTAALTMRTIVAAEPGPDANKYSRLYERWIETDRQVRAPSPLRNKGKRSIAGQ